MTTPTNNCADLSQLPTGHTGTAYTWPNDGGIWFHVTATYQTPGGRKGKWSGDVRAADMTGAFRFARKAIGKRAARALDMKGHITETPQEWRA